MKFILMKFLLMIFDSYFQILSLACLAFLKFIIRKFGRNFFVITKLATAKFVSAKIVITKFTITNL